MLKRRFKGREIPCPSCKSRLKTSWLSGMSNHNGFMYSKDSRTILVGIDGEQQRLGHMGFSFMNSLRCPMCQFEVVKRSDNPSRDKAIFFDGMTYITGDSKYVVEVETPQTS